MKLTKLKLHNFRCVGNEEEVIDIDEITAIIGNNSVGKTTVLAALNYLFATNAKDRILKRSDFHLPKDANPYTFEKQDLYIEVIFAFTEINCNSSEMNSIPIFFNRFVVTEQNGDPYIRIRLEAKWEKSNSLEGAIDSNIYYVVIPESEKLTDESKKVANRKDLEQIRVLYIPAIRDSIKQLKNTSSSMIYTLLNSINWSEKTKTEAQNIIEQFNNHFLNEEGVKIINEAILFCWDKFNFDSRYKDAKLRFGKPDIESTITNAGIVFSPTVTGKEYSVEELSDGLKSLYYISNVATLLEVEAKILEKKQDASKTFICKPPALTIIALEEPENHIAPHLIGKLINCLNNIASKSNAQTIITTHSTAVIRRIEPEHIRYLRLRKENLTTCISKITLPQSVDEEFKYVKEAVKAYPELYFAKLVILGEGDSEELLLRKFSESANCPIDENGISIVPLGGRFVNHFWRLLENLKIPYITLLDLDLERQTGGWKRIKYIIEQLSANKKNIDTIFEQTQITIKKHELDSIDELNVSHLDLLNNFISELEKYHIYFSNPLDIDFLMLEHYSEYYKQLIKEGSGPYFFVEENGKKKKKFINDISVDKQSKEFEAKITNSVDTALKEHGGKGNSYNVKQKELMIWYVYFFLQRSKPTTHIEFLSKITEENLKSKMPDVIKRLFQDANKLLNRFIE